MRNLLLLLFLSSGSFTHSQCLTSYPQQYSPEERYAYLSKEKQEVSGPVKSIVERTSRIHLVSCDSTYDEMVGLIVEHYRDSGKLVVVNESTIRYSKSGDLLSQTMRGDDYRDHIKLKYKNGRVIQTSDFAYNGEMTYDSANRISAYSIVQKYQNPHWKHPGWHYQFTYNTSNQLISIKEKSRFIRTYSYDSLGRLNTIRDVSDPPQSYTITFQYDEHGHKIFEKLVRDDSLSNVQRLTVSYSGETLLKKIYCEYDKNNLETYCMHTCHFTNGKLINCESSINEAHTIFTYVLDEHSNWIEKRWAGSDYEYIVEREISYYE